MLSTFRRVVLAGSLVALAAPSLAWAGGPKDHDKGFFLRMLLGGGGAGTELPDSSFEFSGTGYVFDIAIGGTIAPNLAIHGSYFGWAISDPDVTFGPLSGSYSGTLDLSAFGGGVTYYFMPSNIYLCGNIGVATLSSDGDIEGESDSGYALEFLAGKEWWVGGKWGLGVAGAFGYHSVPEPDIDDNWSGTNWAILFSATFN